MSPFNLEAALAGATVVQRDGRHAEVDFRHGDKLIVILIVLEEDDDHGGFTEVDIRTTVDLDGRYRPDLGETSQDLFMAN